MIKWLLEPEMFQEDEKPLLNALVTLEVPYVACKFGIPYETYLDNFTEEERGVFHGSLQFGKLIQKKSKNISVYCTLQKYECLYYYPRFGSQLLNNNYVMLPIGDLDRRFQWLNNRLSINGKVFIRPNSGSKTFTGVVVGVNDMANFVRYSKTEPEDLIVVATPAEIKKEWRLVVVNNKIITGGQYKEDGEIVRKKDVPNDVMSYGEHTLENVKYNPDPAWTFDICETTDGNLSVLETNSFSCAGFYACDCEAVVKAVNVILEECK